MKKNHRHISPRIFNLAPVTKNWKAKDGNRVWLSLTMNETEPAELVISGEIGKNWWDNSGISGKEFRDALNEVPKGQKINLRINSEGGSVQDGLEIHNAINERSDDITAHIAGYAVSIASVIPLAASRVISPAASVWMIHEPWSVTQGDATEHMKAAEMLDKHGDMLAQIYSKATGKSETEMRDAMKKETWFTGKEAVEFGLADASCACDEDCPEDCDCDCHDEIPKNLKRLDLKAFKNVPQRIYAMISAAPQGAVKPNTKPNNAGGTPALPQENKMNKKILVALLFEHGIKDATGKDLTEQSTDADFETALKTLAAKPGMTSDVRMKALEAKMDLSETRRITDKVLAYVTAGKITNAEAPIFVSAARSDEAGTFKILDEKQAIDAGGAPIGWSGVEVNEDAGEGAHDGVTGLRGPQTEILANIRKEHKTPQARHTALKANYDRALKQAIQKDARSGRRGDVFAANTYSSTLVTSFLMEGSITDLVNVWAFMGAYSLAKDVDPYKPLATGELKHVTSGEATQVGSAYGQPASFEPATGSTISAVPVATLWYNQPCRISAADLNSGLRMEDLRAKALATFSDTVTQAATAPITAATYTATPLIRAAAAFNLSDLATLMGQLQKSPIRNLILDGTYLARIMNQPGFFQKTGENYEATGGYKPFGWNSINLASNWAGAGANIKGFACNPQAIVRATGLPLNPPNIPGGVFQTSTFELPEIGIAVAISLWFSLATRTMFTSWDLIAGFAAVDATAGIVVASGTPS
jgi:ATP-dependent protease ClpP protease subunit